MLFAPFTESRSTDKPVRSSPRGILDLALGRLESRPMDWRLELIAIPVSDVDRAKAFYVDQLGFNADHDHRVTDELRFVQLTPVYRGGDVMADGAELTVEDTSTPLELDEIYRSIDELMVALGPLHDLEQLANLHR